MTRGLTATLVIGLLLSSTPSLRAQPLKDSGLFPAPLLGSLVKGAKYAVVLEVVKVEKGNRLIVFKKAADLKGGLPAAEVRHIVGDPAVLAWAEPGRVAVWFQDGDTAKVCVGNFWYQCSREDETPTWRAQHSLDEYGQTYAGPAERLREHVAAILDGKEVVITARAPRDDFSLPWIESLTPRDWLHGKKGPIWRIKASLRINGLASALTEEWPYFVGWGVGDADAIPGLVKALEHKSARVRAEAAVDLGQLGRTARDALVPLTAALEDSDPHVRIYAAEALGLIDPKHRRPVPVLSEELRDRDAIIRRAAVDALASLGLRAEAAVPALLGLVRKDRDALVRRAAVYALGQIAPEAKRSGSEPKDVVPVLGQVLERDDSEAVRLEVIEALTAFGADAKATLPALIAVLDEKKELALAYRATDLARRLGPDGVLALAAGLQSGDGTFRRRLLAELESLGPDAHKASSAVQLLLADPEAATRVAAATALVRIDPKVAVPAAVPVLRRLLQDEDTTVRWHATMALENLGPPASDAKPELLLALRDESDEVRLSAALAVWRITGRAEPALSILIPMVRGQRRVPPRSERMALKALARMGPDARPAAPTLWRYLRNPEARERPAAALALLRIETRRQRGDVVFDPRVEVLAVLNGMLRRRQQSEEVLAVLRSLGHDARDAVPEIVELLRDERVPLRKAAAETLAAIGPDARSAEPALRDRLKDPNREVRVAAVVALSRVRRDDPESLATLLRICERAPYPEVSRALAGYGARAKAAVPALRRALRHPLYEVHAAAADALKRIDGP